MITYHFCATYSLGSYCDGTFQSEEPITDTDDLRECVVRYIEKTRGTRLKPDELVILSLTRL